MKRLSALVCITFTVAFAHVIVVPDSAATIQDGLAMASSGDTVLVMPDVYEENITWPSTNGIKLYSSLGPDSTTISGGGNGRVIAVGSGITRATEIRGFTISFGKASSAAGLYLQGSPVVRGNKICFNEARGERNYGGGVFCAYNTSPLITENEIANNIAGDSSTWCYGGGIYVDRNCTAEIRRNLVSGNICELGHWNYGAGIYVSSGGRPVIYQNTIVNNENKDGSRGHGAGIYSGGNAFIFCNVIAGNECVSDLWNYGAGIKVSGPSTIISNTITLNACTGGSWRNGGGIYVDINDTAWVKNNIIVSNTAGSGGGIFRFDDTRSVIYNSYNDVWGNTGGNFANCSQGPGSISLDPLFATGPDGNFYLSQVAAGQVMDSPCIDAGDSLLSTSPLNMDSLLRTWTTRTDSGYDVGALDLGYHFPAGVMVAIAEPETRAPRPAVVVSPNPFSGSVRFNVGQNPRDELVLTVSNTAGRVVRRSVGPGPAVAWNGCGSDGTPVAAGVYFCRLVAGDQSSSHRVVKLD